MSHEMEIVNKGLEESREARVAAVPGGEGNHNSQVTTHKRSSKKKTNPMLNAMRGFGAGTFAI